MSIALDQARKAFKKGEVPIGAVIVKDQKIISKAFNQKERNKDTTAHAEILAIRQASKKIGDWRLNECLLFSTVEPCIMCAGAIYHARLKKVYYGCSDPKFGGYGSLTDIQSLKTNHRVIIQPGIRSQEAAGLLQEFFRINRK